MYMQRESTMTKKAPMVCYIRTCTPKPKYATMSRSNAIRERSEVLIDCTKLYWKLIFWMQKKLMRPAKRSSPPKRVSKREPILRVFSWV